MLVVTLAAGADARDLLPDPLASIVLERIADSQSPACIVVGLVEERTRVVFACTRDAGPAKLGRDSLFEIGSITKGVTGILLADMVARGEVSLDDAAARWSRANVNLPPASGPPITLRDLVTQSSGLPSTPREFHPRDPANPYADFDADKLYAALAEASLDAAPGATYAYSNLGFLWLSELLGRRAGKPYDALVKERVLDPLGMSDTAVVLSASQRERFVDGHDASHEVAPHWDFLPELAGAGGLKSSMDDVLKLAEALAGRRRTRLDGAIAAALQPLRPAGMHRIGYAWHVSGPVAWHNGATGGFSATIAVNRARRSAAIVLSDSIAAFGDLAMHLVDPAIPLIKRQAPAAVTPPSRAP